MDSILQRLMKAGQSKGTMQIVTKDGPFDISWDHTSGMRKVSSQRAPHPMKGKSRVNVVHSKDELRDALVRKCGTLKAGCKKLGIPTAFLYKKDEKISGQRAEQLEKKLGIHVHSDLLSSTGRWAAEQPEATGKLDDRL